jgi:putative flippase GtrA
MKQHTKEVLHVTRKDFYLVSIIGASFALLSVPILLNLNISPIPINFINILILTLFFVVFANIALGISVIIGKYIPIVFQIAKFGAVGAFNTFLDWGVLNLLILITGIASGIGFSIFKGISFIIAAISAFYWNKYWTFESKQKTDTAEVGRFVGISVSGFIINVGLASLIIFLFKTTTLVTPEQLANIAAACATLASLVWNFLGYKLFVFKK